MKVTSANDVKAILNQYGIDDSKVKGKDCTPKNNPVKKSTKKNCTKKSTYKNVSKKKTTKKSNGVKGITSKDCVTKSKAVKKVVVKNCPKPSATKPTKPSTSKPTKPSTTKPTKPSTSKPTKPDTTKPDTTKPDNSKPSNGNYNANYANEVLTLVNKERSKAGLAPLTMNAKASEAAKVRAKEIVSIFDHTRPNGQSPFTALDNVGVSYRTAGENIAYGQSTPSEVMNGWMNSSGHRANILKGSFKEIGIGAYYQNGTYYWVQLFIG